MTAALKVIEPGLQTTLQDLGRHGYQKLGIPVAGALDWVSLRIANRLAGNAEGVAGLELSLKGPTLEVAAASVRVALAGTTAPIEVLTPEPFRVPALQSVSLARGQRFRVGGFGDSAVAYLAIEGGLAIAPVLGSLSTHWRSHVGPLGGRKLAAGDTLPLNLQTVQQRPEQRLARLWEARPARFRVVLGPQDDLFDAELVKAFLATTWRVAREADRWGMRLDGPPIAHKISIVSDAIAPGAIQVPAGGQPIVLMADRSTTGGYPKIATVISADLPVLGRSLPGAPVAFDAIPVAEAEAARRVLEDWIAAAVARIEPVAAGAMIDIARLHSENLVSGVIDGAPAE
jgi:allophanate hydrolase